MPKFLRKNEYSPIQVKPIIVIDSDANDNVFDAISQNFCATPQFYQFDGEKLTLLEPEKTKDNLRKTPSHSKQSVTSLKSARSLNQSKSIVDIQLDTKA